MFRANYISRLEILFVASLMISIFDMQLFSKLMNNEVARVDLDGR